ncbi:hypothetical protein P175DRAFT_0481575 [Aspergillus ochraceoroseus IBT 24754]|uniref:Zn(2)-C6 fungal-type domain-containing protein n=2 Tax=Aspergillus ochraceoroseus TaxID=138278 RepID=A0A2T5LVK9_9EURO|nr:uncharacterized protein P175DRAFT_0481575 [Aspergillus ochraceoroseus IBT 24754]KKK18307.1 hypothetical protein AOCH_003480 [Aspergillus ochraceoroseus]PTU20324.1 hypothetical protein P175DRAFT_0481575 [Aspergillus ochraceoroseus IBT 24754]
MASPRYTARTPRRKCSAPPRKKACGSCTKSKVRCDLERPACSRCRSLRRVCQYATPSSIPPLATQHESTQGEGEEGEPITPWISSSILEAVQLDPGLEAAIPPIRPADDGLDFTKVDLVPSQNAENIRDRWLRPYILPPPGQEETPKLYNPFTLQYISRVLSTYPHVMLKDGDVPPIIHRCQVSGPTMPVALANCYSLVRMCIQAAPGSEMMVVSTVEKEMERLAIETSGLYDIELLSAFQAYLLYSIMLYFSLPSGSSAVNDKTMITLMEMAFRTARNGLFSASEISHSRPTWESWIVASTKRRAIFTMYLFSSVYNADRSLPNFIADELRGVYVPEGKSLWEASDRKLWMREYDRHLLSWEDGMFEISELWKSPETGSAVRRKRIERWLRTVDEYGMMLFAVCAHIHGC